MHFINMEAAIKVYKQMILPVLDYSGFMLISCTLGERREFQILPNHATCIRIWHSYNLGDRITIPAVEDPTVSLP